MVGRAGLVVIVGLALALAACASGAPPTVVKVNMKDLAFEPASLSLRKGDEVRIEFNNSAAQAHDFTVDQMPVTDLRTRGEAASAEHDMKSMESTLYSLHLAIAGGKGAWIDFRPTQSGDYEFYCTVPGHREGGMRGTVHVE